MLARLVVLKCKTRITNVWKIKLVFWVKAVCWCSIPYRLFARSITWPQSNGELATQSSRTVHRTAIPPLKRSLLVAIKQLRSKSQSMETSKKLVSNRTVNSILPVIMRPNLTCSSVTSCQALWIFPVRKSNLLMKCLRKQQAWFNKIPRWKGLRTYCFRPHR